MATTNLNPSSTIANDFSMLFGASTAHGALSDTSTTAIGTQYQNDECIVELDDWAVSGATISSIRHYISGYKYLTRGGDVEIQVKLENSSGTDLYSENHTLLFNSYKAQDFYGTSRTTSDGSTAWAASSLNGLRLSINTTPENPDGISYATIVKAYVEVTYTTATVTNDATFFGANF